VDVVRPGWIRGVAVVALVGCASCYDWVAIKPAEIPRFTAGPHELDRPDGSRVRFEGEIAVKVHTWEGTRTYWNPKATIEDRFLVISGDSAPPAEIPLTTIDRAKAGQLSTLETAVVVVVSLAGAAFVMAVYKYSWFNFNSRGVE
jgi:hypothetical protein